MTILIDDAIFRLQAHGGISTLWRKLLPYLQPLLQDIECPTTYLSTYYAVPPASLRSISVVYDCIAEHYPAIGAQHPDATKKRAAIAAADGVVTISEWTATDVRGLTDKPVFVAHCGTDIQRASPAQVAAFKARYGIEKPYVLIVGRRGLYKNVGVIYQAWRFFNAQDNYQVLAIGGEDRTIADNQFAQQYHWQHAHLDDSDLASAYTGAAMVVYPSLFEGFGLPVLEAMACGTPVVCGERSAIPEFAEDSPYYANVFLPLSVADAMNQALQPDFERQQTAMHRAQLYTWERMAQHMSQAIKDIPHDE